jgi:Gnt-I system high-affinity gluconate transporter
MPLVIVVIGVLLLLLLIVVFKLNAFLSFILVALFLGVSQGMTVDATIDSIKLGMGSTLGSLVMILGLGAMLGKMVADSGAAQKITSSLVEAFGVKYIQWALVITGFIVGIPMFYSVGFVILIPLVFTVAVTTKLPILYVGIPMLASLSVTHGYLPPHPAPTAISEILGADIGLTLLYGIVIAIPAIILGGVLFSRTLTKYNPKPLKEFYNDEPLPEDQLPSITISLIAALMPLILIGTAALSSLLLGPEHIFTQKVGFIGNPAMAMLISVFFAMFTLGLRNGKKMTTLMGELSVAVSSITMILLIIAGAGAFKQVLIDTGVSDYIGGLLTGSTISPLVLAWLIAAVIRVCVGSATVAGLTAAGIILPIVGSSTVPTELLVLAIGSGSLMLSHVNDSGFWMFKEYFNMSIRDTFKTWTVMESIVSVAGLLGVLVLNMFI